MATKICEYDGCDSTKIRARGLCGTHYNKLRRAGAFEKATPTRSRVADLDEFLVAEVDASEHTPSARNLYYRAVSEGLLKKDEGNTRAAYNQIVVRCVELRKSGRIGWDRIADESRQATVVDHFDNRDIPAVERVTDNLNWSYYTFSPWHEKETIAEVWCESRSAAQTLREACSSLHVDVVPLGGQASYAFIREQVLKIDARGKPTHVLLLSDHDKSGYEIAAKAQEKAEYFADIETYGLSITFERIGITPRQIIDYGLNTGEPNAKSRQHAPWITETCEIEAMRIDDLVALVIDALGAYITAQDIADLSAYRAERNGEVREVVRDVHRYLADRYGDA